MRKHHGQSYQTISISQTPLFPHLRAIHTNTHDNQEPRQKPPQLYDTAPTPAIHEIISIPGFSAHPVGYGGDAVGCDDEKGEVVVEERRAEDHKEKADGEDLVEEALGKIQMGEVQGTERTKERTMMVLMPAVAMLSNGGLEAAEVVEAVVGVAAGRRSGARM